MDHVAIMNTKWKLIEKLISGEKTIESRWSVNKIAPWNKIKIGETIYFKNSGGVVEAKAKVKTIQQFENLDDKKIGEIAEKYGDVGKIGLTNISITDWGKGKKYCVLIWLENVKRISPFKINKKGFGNSAAWLCIKDIEEVKNV